MTTVRITLPDELAREAERAGLLAPEAVERMLRERLRTSQVSELFEAMDRMQAADEPPMTPEEIQAEIRAARVARRGG
jgi:hypothetical protein